MHDDFENPKIKAEGALEEAIKDIPYSGYIFTIHRWLMLKMR
ncbi:hypothetical protein [Borreliella americana]|nr:hypothetical protein [Borreliella americana]